MPARLTRAAAAACLLALTPAAPAADRGKERLPVLFAEVASSVADSVVRVRCDDRPAALGAIVTSDGLIVTKGSELRGPLTCVLRDGSSHDARFEAYHRATDLALLRINQKGLRPLTFAPASEAEAGNWVASVDQQANPVAVGVVSAAARKLYRAEAFEVNKNKGALGVRFDVAPKGGGILVEGVNDKSAAERAGVRVDDVILEIDGRSLGDPADLTARLDFSRPGDTITLRVRRAGQELNLDVVLGTTADLVEKGKHDANFSRDVQNAMGSKLSGRRTGFPRVIQHDSVVKVTDCGGPLVDLDGRVIGLNIARAGRVESWALPGEDVVAAIKQMKSGRFPPPVK